MPDIRDQQYQIEPLTALKLHPENARKGDVGAIAQSIAHHGFYGAVIAQRSTGYVLAGNGRLQAAAREGLAEIPVLWLDVDDQTARKILAADNRLSDVAEYDEQSLAELLTSIQGETGSLEGTGFSQEAFDAIVAEMGDILLAGRESAPAAEQPPASPIVGVGLIPAASPAKEFPAGPGKCQACGRAFRRRH